MVKSKYLALSWSTSRGRETFGYNICRLDDRETDIRYKCMGGGYDMIGTVIGHWLMDAYADRLQENRAEVLSMYGAKAWQLEGKISLDGGCGAESMIKIAAVIGLRVTGFYNKRTRRNDGYFVTDFGSADALKAAE